MGARGRWKRHRFTKPAEPRPNNYRKHHETEVWEYVAAGFLSPRAATVHLALVSMSNDRCDDLDWVRLDYLAKRLRMSVRSLSRYRRELVRQHFEEHEHRCEVLPDGTVRGLPNRIRFRLPPMGLARVKARLAAGHAQAQEKRRKRGPTPKATQNRPVDERRAIEARRSEAAARARAIQEARQRGKLCPAGCDEGWVHAEDGPPERCPECGGTGVDQSALGEVFSPP